MDVNKNLFSFPKPVNHWFMDFRSKIGNEKLVLGVDSKSHLTIHFGTKSKIVDIHLTDESKSGKEKYTTLLKMSHEDGIQLMEDIANVFKENLEKFSIKKINLGKLNRHNCILSPTENTPHITSTLIKQKRSKFKFQKKISFDNLNRLYLYPTDQIEFHKSKSFMVHKYRKSALSFEGIIMFPNHHSTRKPYFLSKRDLNRIKKKQFEVIFNFVRNKRIEIDSDLSKKIEKFVQTKYPFENWKI